MNPYIGKQVRIIRDMWVWYDSRGRFCLSPNDPDGTRINLKDKIVTVTEGWDDGTYAVKYLNDVVCVCKEDFVLHDTEALGRIKKAYQL